MHLMPQNAVQISRFIDHLRERRSKQIEIISKQKGAMGLINLRKCKQISCGVGSDV